MYAKEKVDEVVAYILAGNNVTNASNHFGKARKTINSMLDTVRREDGDYYNKVISEKITLTLQKLLLESRAAAGAKSKREIVISDEQALEISDAILKGATLRALANDYKCSHTTIANAFRRTVNKEMLQQIIESTTSIDEKEHLKKMLGLLEDKEVISQMPNQEVYEEIKNIYRGK
ncbi:MAG: hypothetical protein NC483_03035 [Ruminococcus sp.]|nr:hypothetical protein [Ruminococcus sp.]